MKKQLLRKCTCTEHTTSLSIFFRKKNSKNTSSNVQSKKTYVITKTSLDLNEWFRQGAIPECQCSQHCKFAPERLSFQHYNAFNVVTLILIAFPPRLYNECINNKITGKYNNNRRQSTLRAYTLVTQLFQCISFWKILNMK